jgi:pyruvate formate lyase activating enzyme
VPHRRSAAAAAALPLTAADGRVHSWDVSTGVDGPGTRLVVFLAGCPLRCLYCQNPDTWRMRDGGLIGVADVERRMQRYAGFVTTAGGGVTVSGGEPLLQPAFTRGLLEAAKGIGLHTALDTAGSLGDRADDRLLAATDLVLLDIKAGSEDTYHRLTGGALAPTLAFADRLAAIGKPVWVRYVLVPGWTDAPDEIAAVADRCASLANVERVDVLAFHTLGRPKYERLGIPFPLADTPAPAPEQVAAARAVFAARGLSVS